MTRLGGMRRLSGNWFVAALSGAVLASVAWLAFIMVASTSPEDARASRAAPHLSEPTATVRRTVLQQSTVHDCHRESVSLGVPAPAVPDRYRPVVTAMAISGTRVRTGTELFRVANQPVFAVSTKEVLYRDLSLGDRGPDVLAFQKALRRAGLAVREDAFMDAATVATWKREFDGSSPSDRVRISSLVAVPTEGRVVSSSIELGDSVRPGAEVLSIQSESAGFMCSGVNPQAPMRPALMKLDVNGRQFAVATVSSRAKDGEAPADILVVPAQWIAADAARLVIDETTDRDAVLAVPLSAVKVAEDGSTSIVLMEDGAPRPLSVVIGVSAQGLVEVSANGLKAGDRVALFDVDPAGLAFASSGGDS